MGANTTSMYFVDCAVAVPHTVLHTRASPIVFIRFPTQFCVAFIFIFFSLCFKRKTALTNAFHKPQKLQQKSVCVLTITI